MSYLPLNRVQDRGSGTAADQPRFIVRDFKWDDEAYEKQQQELADLEVEEKELWVSAQYWMRLE